MEGYLCGCDLWTVRHRSFLNMFHSFPYPHTFFTSQSSLHSLKLKKKIYCAFILLIIILARSTFLNILSGPRAMLVHAAVVECKVSLPYWICHRLHEMGVWSHDTNVILAMEGAQCVSKGDFQLE